MTDAIVTALRLAKRSGVAIVGASPKPERASYDIMRALQHFGVDCIPINPIAKDKGELILGKSCYGSLTELVGNDTSTSVGNTSTGDGNTAVNGNTAASSTVPATSIDHRKRVVCVFRSDVGPVVEEALKCGFPAIWLQSGLRFPPGFIDGEKSEKIKEKGIVLVEDRCMKVEWRMMEGKL